MSSALQKRLDRQWKRDQASNWTRARRRHGVFVNQIAAVTLIGLLIGLSVEPYRYAILRAHMADLLTSFAGHRTAIVEYYTMKGSWPDAKEFLFAPDSKTVPLTKGGMQKEEKALETLLSAPRRAVQVTLSGKEEQLAAQAQPVGTPEAQADLQKVSVDVQEGEGIADWRRRVQSRLTSLLTSPRLQSASELRQVRPEAIEEQAYLEDLVADAAVAGRWFDQDASVVVGGSVIYLLRQLSAQLDEMVFFSMRPVTLVGSPPRLVWFSCGARTVPDGMRAFGPALATIADLQHLPLCRAVDRPEDDAVSNRLEVGR